MHTGPRRPLLFLMISALAVVACGPGDAGSPGSVHPPDTATPAAPPASTEPGTGASASTTQTDTEWGPIWDAIPAGFPTYPGSTVADDVAAEPVSARFAVDGDAQEIAGWYQAGLEAAAYRTEAMAGPLEDGRFVLDSVGEGDCRIQVEVVPMGGMTVVSVRYGADCPA